MDVMHPCVTNAAFVVPIQRTVHHKNESLNDDNSRFRKNQKFSLVMCTRVSDAPCQFATKRFIILSSSEPPNLLNPARVFCRFSIFSVPFFCDNHQLYILVI